MHNMRTRSKISIPSGSDSHNFTSSTTPPTDKQPVSHQNKTDATKQKRQKHVSSTFPLPPQSRTSVKRTRRNTPSTENPAKPPKTRKYQDDIFMQVRQYLIDTDPSLWSLEHLKSTIGPKKPARQRWYFLEELEEIRSDSSVSSNKRLAAQGVLKQLNPGKVSGFNFTS